MVWSCSATPVRKPKRGRTMYDDFDNARHAPIVGTLTGHRHPVTAMAWSPDGEWLASTSLDGVLNLWSRIGSDTRPRFQQRINAVPTPGFTSVAWSPDGDYIACGATGGQLELYEASGLRPIAYSDRGARASINCVAWAVGPRKGDLRLAFGSTDQWIHLRNFRNWDKPDI